MTHTIFIILYVLRFFLFLDRLVKSQYFAAAQIRGFFVVGVRYIEPLRNKLRVCRDAKFCVPAIKIPPLIPPFKKGGKEANNRHCHMFPKKWCRPSVVDTNCW